MLSDSTPIHHHIGKAAFDKFLRVARDPKSIHVTIGGKDQDIAGTILGWAVVTPAGRVTTMNQYQLADVLSVEDMLVDLAHWQSQEWAKWVGTRQRWTNELFDWLADPTTSWDGVDADLRSDWRRIGCLCGVWFREGG